MNASRKHLVSAFLAAACCLAGPPAQARKWSLYRNKRYKFQLVVPEGWSVSEARTHPSIILALLHPSGAQARLAATVPSRPITLRAFAREEVQVVRKIGFPVGVLLPFSMGRLHGLWARGAHPKKASSFRLYFFQRGRAFFVFTFTYPTKSYPKVFFDYRVFLKTFRFTD